MNGNDGRKIIHIDMDAFFASVEQRDHPEYKGKPVVVGGLPHTRGVVATCSYEARKYGIHSAMPARRAYQRCPHAIFVRPRMERYREVSQRILNLFRSYTDRVEPLALDEAYLDVTENKRGIGSATLIARQIKHRIFEETQLTASAGVSYNKFLAKTASDYQKPDGLTVVTPEQASGFINEMPIGKFFGVGKKTEAMFLKRGIRKGADLKKLSLVELIQLCGQRGELLYQHVRGIDSRPVQANRRRKSLGKETTLAEDLYELEEMLPVLEQCARHVSRRLQEQGLVGRSVVLKIRFHDFKQITRRMTIEPTQSWEVIMVAIGQLLERVDFATNGVRLLGVSVTDLQAKENHHETGEPVEYIQLELPF